MAREVAQWVETFALSLRTWVQSLDPTERQKRKVTPQSSPLTTMQVGGMCVLPTDVMMIMMKKKEKEKKNN